jgi:hypothetical protein
MTQNENHCTKIPISTSIEQHAWSPNGHEAIASHTTPHIYIALLSGALHLRDRPTKWRLRVENGTQANVYWIR